MGFLTPREREIILMLKGGKTVKEIGKHFQVSDTSISRSISNIRTKTLDLEDDIEFLLRCGFLRIEGGSIEFVSKDRDPKALARLKRN